MPAAAPYDEGQVGRRHVAVQRYQPLAPHVPLVASNVQPNVYIGGFLLQCYEWFTLWERGTRLGGGFGAVNYDIVVRPYPEDDFAAPLTPVSILAQGPWIPLVAVVGPVGYTGHDWRPVQVPAPGRFWNDLSVMRVVDIGIHATGPVGAWSMRMDWFLHGRQARRYVE